MTPREIIADVKIDDRGEVGERAADAILSALATAGWRIVAPGEMDRETVERCAKVAERDGSSHSAPYPHSRAWVNNTGQQTIAADRIATTIRALVEPKP